MTKISTLYNEAASKTIHLHRQSDNELPVGHENWSCQADNWKQGFEALKRCRDRRKGHQ